MAKMIRTPEVNHTNTVSMVRYYARGPADDPTTFLPRQTFQVWVDQLWDEMAERTQAFAVQVLEALHLRDTGAVPEQAIKSTLLTLIQVLEKENS